MVVPTTMPTPRAIPRCRRRSSTLSPSAPNVTQFLDRDASPEFASNVAGPGVGRLHRGSHQDRLDPRGHAGPGRGHLQPSRPYSARRSMPAGATPCCAGAESAVATATQVQDESGDPRSDGGARQSPVRRTRPLGSDPDGGIPTILHVTLIWIPTIASICLSFTSWRGIRFSEMKWVGLKNYRSDLHRLSEELLPGSDQQHGAAGLPLHLPDHARHVPRLSCSTRTSAAPGSFQSIFYTPVVLSLAVVGFMWQSVIYSTANGLATQIFGHGKADRLARQPSRS